VAGSCEKNYELSQWPVPVSNLRGPKLLIGIDWIYGEQPLAGEVSNSQYVQGTASKMLE
jgi:hypothetical protein